ncbi:hypothetical protein ACI8AG_10925 [Blastococcus sp. SYSU DS0552]
MITRLRTGVVALFVLGLAAVLGGSLVGPADTQLREAADLKRFNAGNIVSDGVFYDTSTMSADQIQAFLTSKNSGLRSLRVDTFTRTSSPCGTYHGGGQETAAWVIYKVAKACGINPQALLVILQKEQGLVTDATPSHDQLRKAMGYGCPDTPAGCDATWNGFFNQVYMASRQFKLYQANPTKYGYVAGRTNYISYQANNAGCGKASVFIENQATAGLYNYTPYVPNDAALRAGYGTGDVCSAYGNRNFYQYFVDWFGSTQSSGGSQIVDKYNALKAIGVDLGASTGDALCDQPYGGCWRPYQGGHIFWHPVTGARVVRGAILDRYLRAGGPGGNGYPTGDDALAPGGGGYLTTFQWGDIYWSPSTGAQIVRGEILAKWYAMGGPTGSLGYPSSTDALAPGGRGFVVDFQHGSLYWSPNTGAHVVRGALLARYRALGGPQGLGYPTGDDQSAAGGGFMTPFEWGDLYWSAAHEVKVVKGAILAAYKKAGGPAALGYPTGDDQPAAGGGFMTPFERGEIYWSAATDARILRGQILTSWKAAGGPRGYGYPTSDSRTIGNGETGAFQRGELYWSAATGARIVRGAILDTWKAAGGATGYLGFPTTDDALAPGGKGFVVDFQGGSVYWSAATQAKIVRGAILATYRAAGGPPALGYPTGNDSPAGDGRGFKTTFQYADIFWSSTTGAHVVRGAIHTTWMQLGGSKGYLGYPITSDALAPGGGGYVVDFEGGSLYWSPAAGTKVVRGAILATYRAAGGPQALGFPTGNDAPAGDGRGYKTAFQYAEIYWSATTGAHVVRGAIHSTWMDNGGVRGSLGYPRTSDALVPGGGGYVVDFEYGAVYWSPATGTKIVRGAILDAYRAAGGPAVLGFPTTSDARAPGGQGYMTSFQGGTIYWSATTQARVLRTELNAAYLAQGGTTGPLGYPISDTVVVGAQQRAEFQNGVLTAP